MEKITLKLQDLTIFAYCVKLEMKEMTVLVHMETAMINFSQLKDRCGKEVAEVAEVEEDHELNLSRLVMQRLIKEEEGLRERELRIQIKNLLKKKEKLQSRRNNNNRVLLNKKNHNLYHQIQKSPV